MYVYASDLHLTPLIWQDMPDVRGDAYFAWDQVVEAAIDSEGLIIGGDIFDKRRPDSESVAAFIGGILRLMESKVPVYYIQGQHERADPPWVQAITDYPTYIADGNIHTLSGGQRIQGYDCMAAADLQRALQMDLTSEYDILVVHQLSKPFISFDGGWDFDPAWAPKYVKLMLAGDYHELANTDNLWSAGSTTPRNSKQFSDRHILYIDCKDDYNVRPAKLLTRPFIKRVLNSDDDVDQLMTQVAGGVKVRAEDKYNINKPIAIIKYSIDLTDAVAKLEDICYKYDWHLFAKPVTAGSEVVADLPTIDGEITLSSCLASVVDRDKDFALYSFVLDLLRTDNPKEVLEKVKQQLEVSV